MGYRPLDELPVLQVREEFAKSRERSIRRHNQHLIVRYGAFVNRDDFIKAIPIAVAVVIFLSFLKAVIGS